MKKVFITSLAIFIFILAGTAAAIIYGKGYRIIPENGKTMFAGTGLLVTTSKPDGAKVFINDHLTTATNNTINLSPGEYNVKIIKDGYFPWQKKITIKKEIVSKAEALLIPTAPKLEAVTTVGAENPVIDSSGSLLAYTVSSSSAEKNGIYVLNLDSKPILNIGGAATQIADDTINLFSKSQLEFAPDGTQILASIQNAAGSSIYTLSTKGLNPNPQDTTLLLDQVKANWEKQKYEKERKLIDAQNSKLSKMIKANFTNISFSPDRDKVLYTASTSASLPLIISPRLIGTNSTLEERNIRTGNIYVYDIKEDRNYLIFENPNPPTPTSIKKQIQTDEEPISTQTDNMLKYVWHPDSNHLFFISSKKINILEFDGQNTTVVYAGPFLDGFVFPWPDGSSIVFLTNLNTENNPYNLYRLSLK